MAALGGRDSAVGLGDGEPESGDGSQADPGGVDSGAGSTDPIGTDPGSGGGTDPGLGFEYDVSRDGRFLINTVLQEGASPITLIQNWRPQAK